MFPISSASTSTAGTEDIGGSAHASPSSSSVQLECRVPNAPPPRVKHGVDIGKKKPGRQPGAVRTSRYANGHHQGWNISIFFSSYGGNTNKDKGGGKGGGKTDVNRSLSTAVKTTSKSSSGGSWSSSRRRTRGGGVGVGGGGATLTSVLSSRSLDQESTDTDDSKHKLDDNDYIRTVVVISAKDEYVIEMVGSFLFTSNCLTRSEYFNL
jgi:hypothetical protein